MKKLLAIIPVFILTVLAVIYTSGTAYAAEPDSTILKVEASDNAAIVVADPAELGLTEAPPDGEFQLDISDLIPVGEAIVADVAIGTAIQSTAVSTSAPIIVVDLASGEILASVADPNNAAIIEPEPTAEATTVESPRQPLLASVPLGTDLQWQIYAEGCQSNKNHFCLIMAMSRVESGFRILDVSKDGKTWGHIQVDPVIHKGRMKKFGATSAKDLLDPIICTKVGLDYLKELAGSDQFEPNHLVLMQYNMGPGGAAKVIRQGYTSSYYSRQIMAYYKEYLAEFSA